MTTKRIRQIVLGLLFGVWVSSCQQDNPAYLGKVPRDAGPDVAAVTTGEDVLPAADTAEPLPDVDEKADQRLEADAGDTASGRPDAGTDVENGDDVVPNPDEEVDVPPTSPDGADGGDVNGLDTRDGRDGRGIDGPETRDLGKEPIREPDGSTDETFDGPASDGTPDVPVSPDGPIEAVGTAEVAVDTSPTCREGDQRSVVSPSNPLVGPCRAGQQTCTAGAWVTSVEEVLPATEKCNGSDDNCNGMVDEGCASQCIVVSRAGSASGDGSAQNPFATIEQAIAAAGAGDGGLRTQVCVSGGASCQAATTYPSAAAIAMRDGISVQGNYALTETGLTYCGFGAQPTTTIEFSGSDQGVVFGQDVVSRTELSGFVIHRFSASTAGGPGTTASVAGVVISGAKDVWLSRIFVDDPVEGASTYGVSIGGGGRATIVGSAIGGGLGRTSAVGVYVSGGSLDLRNNCDGAVAGICKTSCSDSNASLGIRGRHVGGTADPAGETSAVFLDNSGTSPGTASTVVGNMICGGPGNLADTAASGAGVAALRCGSGGCGLVSGNTIAGGGGRPSVGVAVAGGQGGLITANRIQGGCGAQSVAGVLLESTAAQLENNLIFGGSCSNAGVGQTTYYGVHVVLGGAGVATAADFQVHSNDIEPEGASGDCESVGVFLQRQGGGEGPATGILRNNIISMGLCDRRYAVSESSGALLHFLENNDLYGGAPSETAALYRRNNDPATTEDAVNALAGASNNISADPQYVSYPADLHLASGSRCIDHGTATGAPSSDAEGTYRPQGVGYDIGAFELKN